MAHNQAFCYDEQNRLTWTAGEGATGPCGVSITTGTLAAAAYGTGAVTYDPLDRMTSSSSGSNVYGDSAHPHAQTSNGPANSASYDAAGDMTCRSTTSNTQCSTSGQNGQLMAYDSEGRMTSWQDAPTNPTNTENMAYDGEGNRVALQVNGGTPTYYVGSLEELSGGSVTKYFTGGSQGGELPLVERVGTGGALAYLGGDLLGSVDATLDGSGNVTSQQLFLPFGNPVYSSGTPPTAKAFTSQRKDATSGLYYYNARYYDPTGRTFVSADTVRDGQNPYAYAHFNPETLTDPTGHGTRTCGVSADFCSGPGGAPVSSPPAGCRATHDCGPGGLGGVVVCDTTCQLDQRIDSTFANKTTRTVLRWLANTPIGRYWLQFILAVGAQLGDTFITWNKKPGAYSYTDPLGYIDMGTIGAKWTYGDAAASLVHEAVESYYAIVYGLRGQASQHMDYVAQWYAGEFEEQSMDYHNSFQDDPYSGGYKEDTKPLTGTADFTSAYAAYGLSFAQWKASNNFAYQDEPETQDTRQIFPGRLFAGIRFPSAPWVTIVSESFESQGFVGPGLDLLSAASL